MILERNSHVTAAVAAGCSRRLALAQWRLKRIAIISRQPTLDAVVVPVDNTKPRRIGKPGPARRRTTKGSHTKRVRRMTKALKKRIPDGAGSSQGADMDAYTVANRSLEVDYDGIIILPGNPERVGRVAGFIWNDHQGYRMPDEMDIEYVEEGGSVLEEVSLSDQQWSKARDSRTVLNDSQLRSRAKETVRWSRERHPARELRQRLEADCILTGVSPVKWWDVVCEEGFMEATSMSKAYWAATITAMHRAFTEMQTAVLTDPPP